MEVERIREAVEKQEGWCSFCRDFTRDKVEPNADGYQCPVCGKRTVKGVEAALLDGEFKTG